MGFVILHIPINEYHTHNSEISTCCDKKFINVTQSGSWPDEYTEKPPKHCIKNNHFNICLLRKDLCGVKG